MDTKNILMTAGVLGVTGLVFGRKYFGGGVCNITKDLIGQVVIVTGSNTGIGKETARVLAGMGATVILACRDATKTQKVVEELKEDTKNNNIEFVKLDLSDLKSIKEFSEEFRRKYNKLNILINNAGVMGIPERKLTKDGFEMQFGTNVLGHFYLTMLLTDLLKSSAPSRVINLSSMLSGLGKMHWEDVMLEKNYNLDRAYQQSKLAINILTKEFQRRLKDSNVKVVSLHPGVVTTDLHRNYVTKWYFKVAFTLVVDPVIYLFGKTPLQGAQTSLYCALEDAEKLQDGAFYSDCKLRKENPEALKEENWKRLYDLCEKCISEKIN